jgi:hypothetical protein
VAQLGRESEIFVICIYLFDPIFYEANESSSTCGPGFTLKVETFTPPYGTLKIRLVFENASGGACWICRAFLLCAL